MDILNGRYSVELSEMIAILNERFGAEFIPEDQPLFDSIKEDAVADQELQQAAHANTMENFGYIFKRALEGLFIDRMEQNEEMAAKFINDPEFQKLVRKKLLKDVYEQIRSESNA